MQSRQSQIESHASSQLRRSCPIARTSSSPPSAEYLDISINEENFPSKVHASSFITKKEDNGAYTYQNYQEIEEKHEEIIESRQNEIRLSPSQKHAFMYLGIIKKEDRKKEEDRVGDIEESNPEAIQQAKALHACLVSEVINFEGIREIGDFNK